MIIMPANNSGWVVGYLAAKYPGKIGWLMNAMSFNGTPEPRKEMPWAMDNGAYIAYKNRTTWDEQRFLDIALSPWHPPPMWIAIPDVVANKDKTIEMWIKYSPMFKNKKKAFVVQDGMIVDDVPKDADVIFIGGTTEWKWATLKMWCDNFPRVHVGRVNSERLLWSAHRAGAESCDGTGWFRGNKNQLIGLFRFLYEVKNKNQLTFMEENNA